MDNDVSKELEVAWQNAKAGEEIKAATVLMGGEVMRMIENIWKSGYLKGYQSGIKNMGDKIIASMREEPHG